MVVCIRIEDKNSHFRYVYVSGVYFRKKSGDMHRSHETFMRILVAELGN